MNAELCPECGGNGKEIHIAAYSDVVDRVMGCSECQTEWTIAYGEPVVHNVIRDE